MVGKNAHKVDTETTQDMAEKAKKKLFQAFEAEGVHVSESFNASIRGEIKQMVERVKIPDSTSPVGYTLDRQHRLEVPKFSDINQMRQVFILAYHLGIYRVEQDIKRLTEGWKGQWESWKVRRNRYKKAWSYALDWMQDAGFLDHPTNIPKELELELDAAKADTKPPSPMRSIANDVAKTTILGVVKPLLLLYAWTAVGWILIANQVPPFHLVSADQGLADLQQPGIFTAIMMIVFIFMTLYYVAKYTLKQAREDVFILEESKTTETTVIEVMAHRV